MTVWMCGYIPYLSESVTVCVCGCLHYFLCRLSEELKEKDERWLSCQLRCELLREELLVWQQREKQQVPLRTAVRGSDIIEETP